MNKAAIGSLFYQELRKIGERATTSQVLEELYLLMGKIFVEITQKERLQFTTLFSRMVYVSQTFQLDKRLQIHLHHFRKAVKELPFMTDQTDLERLRQQGTQVLARLIKNLFDVPYPEYISNILPTQVEWDVQPIEIEEFKAKVRVVLINEDRSKELLRGHTEDNPSESVFIQYNIPERNEHFNSTIQAIRQVFGFPVTVNLLDIEITKEGIYRPRAFVVEPDYLIDISAIALCFHQSGAYPLLYLLKKFIPVESNKYLLIGNIANFFLDELLSDPNKSYTDLLTNVFQLNPFAFCLMEDGEIKSLIHNIQNHYLVLQKAIRQDFPAEGINVANCFLEPSFYSETYGIQGRLDIFFQQEKNAAIIELKSGKAYQPNIYGISASHFMQTLLYDLLIRSVYPQTNPKNYILYSSIIEKSLRFAPRIKAQQYEALQIRNQLVAIEWELKTLPQLFNPAFLGEQLLERPIPFKKISTSRFPQLQGFIGQEIAMFEKTYQSLSKLEQKYFIAFSGFIAREHQLAKTGMEAVENANGQAALWLNLQAEKNDQFELLQHLVIISNQSQFDDPIIHFQKTAQTNPLANFRKGDIAVLYPEQVVNKFPASKARPAILAHQIFKCTIVELGAMEVSVQLKSKQFNTSTFENFTHWNLEHDLMDSSFTTMYRGLFQFMQAPLYRRNLYLTLQAPKRNTPLEFMPSEELTTEQQRIFKQVIGAEDYFLLWGPPGTGKTNMMLKHLVKYFLENSQEQLLLLAYTNRAVDEICESIERIAPNIKNQYIRIGSRHSTEKEYHSNLLEYKMNSLKTRKQIKALIDTHRIFVGTVSSIANKPELLKLKIFDRVIIDEASQILEPLLLGLLSQFQRCILIGDHQQLPAVVAQEERESRIYDRELHTLGLKNLRNSLFERLFQQCQVKGWFWAYAQLSHQGRMHQEIMEFPNRHFYQNTLNILPTDIPYHLRQLNPLNYTSTTSIDFLFQKLVQQRVLFIPTPKDTESTTGKTNRFEAEMICTLILHFQQLYQFQQLPFHVKSIGVITPYRAQIAQIRAALQAHSIDIESITIDTVERYQGSAREIILISLCTNNISQLQGLVSLSEEGVDRKLNVALTRAKEHLIVLGNPDILNINSTYRAFIETYNINI